MRERTIFLNAVDRADPETRRAYLDEACAGNPALRRRIEALLRSHEEAGSFLTVPALEQMTRDDQVLSLLAPAQTPGGLGRLDHYEVLEIIGRGGAGLVLKAWDTKLERLVAIKVLAPLLAASAVARGRFVREARATAAVRDDHVVAIHAVSDEGPVPYLVMEYLAGPTLTQRINQQGALGLEEILSIGAQAARGLAAAHTRGLIHRDIKPGNILLESDLRRVKITDFGLARAADAGGLAPGKMIAGTPPYMSPEQARGEPLDPRSDLFSLGSVLYALCTGRPPFPADTTPAVLKQVCEDEPRPIRDLNPRIPDWLCDLIARLHAKEAGARFASAQEVADLLAGGQARPREEPPAAREEAPNPAETPGRSNPRGKSLFSFGCLLALLAAFNALATDLMSQSPRGPAPDGRPGRQTNGKGKPAPAPLELRREDIPPNLLALAGGLDPAKAPPELAAVLGDGRFLLPRVGQTAWPEQSPDGKILAVPLDEDVALFAAPAGTYLRTLKGPGGRAFFVTFSRDSRLLAVTTRLDGSGGSVRVWDLGAGRELFTRRQTGLTISCAATFSADGKRLFTEVAGRISVRDARSGRQVQFLEVSPKGIASLSFSPDGTRLAATTWHGNGVKIFAWARDRLTEVATLSHPWPTVAAVFSPDGNFLASSDLTGVKLWDARTLKELRSVPGAGQQLAFTPDGRTLLAATTTDQPRAVYPFTRWDVGTGKELPALKLPVAAEPVRAFHCLGRDGKTLYGVAQHGATYVRAFDAATGRELFPPRGHSAPLNAVAVSPDGRLLASGGQDWTVKIWDLATGRVRHSLSAHTAAVCGLAFSPNGKLLASASRDGTIALWDVAAGTEVRGLHGHSRAGLPVRFSPGGRRRGRRRPGVGRGYRQDGEAAPGARRPGALRRLQPRRQVAGLGRRGRDRRAA